MKVEILLTDMHVLKGEIKIKPSETATILQLFPLKENKKSTSMIIPIHTIKWVNIV